MEANSETTPGPAERAEAAHHSAAVLVEAGRANCDDAVTARLVALVEELGLPTLADLWADRPARSLPGALWRLYALREWVQRVPIRASREYAAGVRFTDFAHVVAGVAEPPGPNEVRQLADQILTGVFAGDLDVALERAAAFAAVIAAGRADLADDLDAASESHQAESLTVGAAAMQRTGEDLLACARLWRSGELI